MSSRPLTKRQRDRADRLFLRAAVALDSTLGDRVQDISTARKLDAGEQGIWSSQSFNDGECEYTLELTAVRVDG